MCLAEVIMLSGEETEQCRAPLKQSQTLHAVIADEESGVAQRRPAGTHVHAAVLASYEDRVPTPHTAVFMASCQNTVPRKC